MAGVPPGSADDLEYGSLVVAPGAQLAPEAVDGFDEMALDLHSTEGCGRIHAALSDFEEGVVGILVPELPFTCPAAPYEAAFLAESFLRRRGIRRNVEIHLFTPVHAPMPVAPAALGDSIADLLAARGIHWHPLFTFEELRPERREVVSSAGVHHVDLLMCIPPPSSTRGPPLVPAARALRFVHVDAQTLETDVEGVYAIGDVATVKLPNGKALPKAGVFAHVEAKVVARRVAEAAEGKTSDAVFDGHGYCWIELGDGRAGFAGGDFYAEPEPRITIRRPGRAPHWGRSRSRSGGSITGSSRESAPQDCGREVRSASEERGRRPTTVVASARRRGSNSPP